MNQRESLGVEEAEMRASREHSPLLPVPKAISRSKTAKLGPVRELRVWPGAGDLVIRIAM